MGTPGETYVHGGGAGGPGAGGLPEMARRLRVSTHEPSPKPFLSTMVNFLTFLLLDSFTLRILQSGLLLACPARGAGSCTVAAAGHQVEDVPAFQLFN